MIYTRLACQEYISKMFYPRKIVTGELPDSRLTMGKPLLFDATSGCTEEVV